MARSARTALNRLTPGEMEVLTLMAAGLTNRSIAETLFVSQKTVEARIGSIFRRLGLFEDVDENRRVMAVLLYLRAVVHAQAPERLAAS